MPRRKGRPRALMKLPSLKERKELLDLCDRLSLVLKARALLERRVRVNRGELYVERAESDLAHFERILTSAVADFRKATEKVHGLDNAFSRFIWVIEETNKSPDTIFGIENAPTHIVDDLYEASNTWLIAWASNNLYTYFVEDVDDFRESAIDYMSRFLDAYKPKVEKALEIQLRKTRHIKAPKSRADRIVAAIVGLTEDRIKRHRLAEAKNPRWTDDYGILAAVSCPERKGKK